MFGQGKFVCFLVCYGVRMIWCYTGSSFLVVEKIIQSGRLVGRFIESCKVQRKHLWVPRPSRRDHSCWKNQDFKKSSAQEGEALMVRILKESITPTTWQQNLSLWRSKCMAYFKGCMWIMGLPNSLGPTISIYAQVPSWKGGRVGVWKLESLSFTQRRLS